MLYMPHNEKQKNDVPPGMLLKLLLFVILVVIGLCLLMLLLFRIFKSGF